ncbi:helix-turn-helix domain-containing protein [Peribacillus alkalitolerans]|uniref:AlbA family DNA-binding domain-containing protein n=1 Tax=Peribacillus alkalitolerans TaxID=1550385 RepID=UPI0013D116FF|nr:ATP-binding protein [Peribacillus alkalitolerans]
MLFSNIYPVVLKKFLLDPSKENLREVLLHNTGETDFLDFKTKWIELTKLAKHILAIANSGGGCIIVGVSQSSKGTVQLDGLSNQDFLDKADIDNKLQNLLPKYLKYRTEDYQFSKRTHALLQEKRFQVLFIDYDPKYVPYTSIVQQGELRYGAIYVRQGTKSIEASNDKLVEIILRKVQSGGSNTNEVLLQDHLKQLKILYDELNIHSEAEYRSFLKEMIEEKKRVIKKELSLEDGMEL